MGLCLCRGQCEEMGLAPFQGTRASPPPYDIETDSIILATAAATVTTAALSSDSSSSSSSGNNHNKNTTFQINRLIWPQRPLATAIHVGEEGSLLLLTRKEQQRQQRSGGSSSNNVPEPPLYSSLRINPSNNNDGRLILLD